MESFSLRLRKLLIISLTITTSSLAFDNASQKNNTPQTKIEYSYEKKHLVLESFLQGWHALESESTGNFHDLVEFIEDILHDSQPNIPQFKYDVTLVGFVNFADGIGRHPILFKECLEKHVKMNFLSTRNIPTEIEDAQLGLPRLNPNNKEDIGAIAILTDILADKALNIYKKMPGSLIKVAYTMFESTEIPCNWVTILNKKFDMAVVPDPFLVDVYKNCGVKIPIFVLPLPLMLHDFLHFRKRTKPHKPFVFGLSGGFWKRKNHIRVLEAFAAEFGNRSDVKLRLHGRFGEKEIIDTLINKIKEYKLTNVELIVKPYSWDEYLAFFKSLDCYVFLSQGEGFSVSPREALACGLPCILTNNTAQITICDSGAVRVVPSNILIPAFYDCHYNNYHHYPYPFHHEPHCSNNWLDCIDDPLQSNPDQDLEDLLWRSANLGYQFDCTILDARNAMRDVYENYNYYLEKAHSGRKWVKQYLREHLSKKYVSLVKPKTVILGKKNMIGEKFLITDSKALYEKYQYLLGNR
jgi:glycosyltransferase involved in cell wall biosynthesis